MRHSIGSGQLRSHDGDIWINNINSWSRWYIFPLWTIGPCPSFGGQEKLLLSLLRPESPPLHHHHSLYHNDHQFHCFVVSWLLPLSFMPKGLNEFATFFLSVGLIPQPPAPPLWTILKKIEYWWRQPGFPGGHWTLFSGFFPQRGRGYPHFRQSFFLPKDRYF